MKIRTVEDFVTSDIMGTPAEEIVRKATSKLRHSDRVSATKEAAYNAAPKLDHTGGKWHEQNQNAATAVLLIADYLGCGGGTIRHPAFQSLGKGRRQASDGPAYIEAEYNVLSDMGYSFAVVHNNDDDQYLLVTKDISKLGWNNDTIPCSEFNDLFPDSESFHEYDLVEILGKEWAVIFASELLRMACDSEYKNSVDFPVHFVQRTSVGVCAKFYNLVIKASQEENEETKEN